jgi:hypothetical protein
VKVDNPQENRTPGVLYSHWTNARLGIDEETAKQIALEDAQRDLGVWLRSRNIKWRPAPGYVEQLVRDKSVGKESTSDGDAPTVKLLVEVRNDDYQDILNAERQAQRDNNQIFLARVLATIVAICAAISGYLRLDEATKGYYTNLLRLGSLAVVSAVGAGVWLFA